MNRVKTSLDHKKVRRLICLVLTVFALLFYLLQSVAGSAYYSMLMQAYGTVSSPSVILQNGTAGTSTIYTNKTSALVSVDAPVAPYDFVDNNTSNVDSSAGKGTHSNFTGQQYGPDSIYDTLTEGSLSWWFNGPDSEISFSNTAYDQKHTLPFTAPAQGDYLIFVSFSATTSSTSYSIGFRAQLDDATTFMEGLSEPVSSVTTEDYRSQNSFYLAKSLSSGSHRIDIDAYVESSSYTGYMRYVHIVVLRLDDWLPTSGMHSYNSTDAAVSLPGSEGSWQTVQTVTFIPDQAGDYLVLASMELYCGYTFDSIAARMNYDNGSEYLPLGNTEELYENWVTYEAQDATDWRAKVWGGIVNMATSQKTIKLEACRTGGTDPNAQVRRRRLIALRLAAMDSNAQSTEVTAVTSTTSQWADKSTLTFTPSSQSNYLIFGGMVIKPDSTLYPGHVQLNHVSGTNPEVMSLANVYSHDSSDPADCIPFFTVEIKTLGATSQTFKNQYGYAGTSGTTYGKGSFIVAIRKPAYELDLEVQWTNADYDETNEELAIYFGKGKNTYSLDATGGYMIIGDGTSNWDSVTGTISFWIKWDNVANRPWGQHDNMETRISGQNLVIDWGAAGSLTSSTSFTLGKWYFIAIVWNENMDNLYLYVGDQNNPPTLNAQNNAWASTVSTVGVTQNNFMASKGGVDPTDGRGEELRYWNIDRTLAQIQSDYNIELTGSETNLRSYFKLNNNFDDIGPNNNDGSCSGSYSFSSEVPFPNGTPTENIRVDVWNGTAWQNLFTSLANGWNKVSVSSYLTSSTFTIRFKGSTETGDTTQDNWNIDATLLHVWTNESNYDYVLRVINKVANNWTINLQVYDSSNIARLLKTTISFHDGSSSNQIIVNDGVITQPEGPPYNLAGNATIYISMNNLQATPTGTSHLYVHLKIRVPNTSTYSLYIITFKIT